jgi:hypothetical protein
MHLSVRVGYRVVDHLMSKIIAKPFVGLQGIAIECRPRFYVVAHQCLQVLLLPTIYHLSANLAATLQNRRNDGLALRASAPSLEFPRFIVRVHVASLRADEGFVYFNFARQLAAVFALHSKPNPMEHEPSRLLGDPQRTVNLPRANTILGSSDNPDSGEPLFKADRGILKDRPNLGRELLFGVLRLALPAPLIRQKAYFRATASRASDTVRPAPRNHVVQAIVGVREVKDRLLKCFWFGCACHD